MARACEDSRACNVPSLENTRASQAENMFHVKPEPDPSPYKKSNLLSVFAGNDPSPFLEITLVTI